jgi:hypothetical protein
VVFQPEANERIVQEHAAIGLPVCLHDMLQ